MIGPHEDYQDEAHPVECNEAPDQDYEPDEGPEDHFRDDVEADADTLRNAGWGTDEDYGYYGDEPW